MLALVAVLAVLAFGGVAPAAGQSTGLVAIDELVVAEVRGSPATASDAPAAYLVDDDPATAWRVVGADTGWVELQLAEPAFIGSVALRVDGGAAVAATVQFYQQGWQSFAGAEQVAVTGDVALDLSHDRVVTDRLAIRVAGADLALAAFAGVKVRGVSASSIDHRLALDLEAASAPERAPYRARNLFDGNPFTEWRGRSAPPSAAGARMLAWLWQVLRNAERGVELGVGAAVDGDAGGATGGDDDDGGVAAEEADDGEPLSVSARLPRGADLRAIKVLIGERLHGRARVVLEGSWSPYPLATIGDEVEAGWQVLAVPAEYADAERVTIELSGPGPVIGGVSEVEAWGSGAYAGDRIVPLATIAVGGAAGAGARRQATFTVDDRLPREVELIVDQPLAELEVELNGAAQTAQQVLASAASSRYLLRAVVEPPALWRGANFLSIELPAGVTLHGLRIRQRLAGGSMAVVGGALGDDRLLSAAAPLVGEELVLDGATFIDRVELFSASPGAHDVLAWTQDRRAALALQHGGGAGDSFAAGLSTDRLRIVGAMAAPPFEVRVIGSPTGDQAPSVRLLWPADGMSLPPLMSATGPVIGVVDNPDAVVEVNGVAAQQRGHVFWLPVESLGLTVGQPVSITARAIDAAGRADTDTATVIFGARLALLLDQPDRLTYTAAPAVTISGSSLQRLFRVEVDGEPAAMSRFRFTAEVALEPGLNRIAIQAFSRATGKPVAYAVRHVVRISDPLTIDVDAPPDGATVAAAAVDVSGTVQGAGEVAVAVNGIAGTVHGSRFVVTAVPLAEGANELVLSAHDQIGRSAEARVQVHRDTAAPQLSVDAPAAGALLAHAEVAVAGTVADASTVWVYVNDTLAVVDGGSYSAQLPFADGARSIQVSATDLAGNTATLAPVPFVVDTTPPQPFAVGAAPAGWTNDTQPIITFATTDAVSGVAGYEVNVGGGPFVPAVSPYQLPLQPDGEHTVRVRAIDHAGWSRIETVPIFIDTTPPPAPPAFLAVVGNGQIELRWDPPSDDVITYHLTRTPAWSGGQIVRPAADGLTYLDDALSNGDSYSYQIWAVDRAANAGAAATVDEAIVGLAVAAVAPDNGTYVTYDNVDLLIPQSSLPANIVEVHVSEVESEDLHELAAYPIMGPIYHFSVSIDEGNGELVAGQHVSFEEPFHARLSYDESQLIEGFPEQNIGVYFFDPMWGRWFQVEDAAVDVENDTIHFATNHFSDFSVQPTVIEDLSLQELQDVGHSPFETEVTHAGLSVSPQGGTVMSEVTELVLPGKNGFDFELKRVYDSATARSDGFGLSIFASLATSDIFLGVPLPDDPGDIDPGDIFHDDIFDSVLQGAAFSATDQVAGALLELLQDNGDWGYSTGLGWRLNLPYIRSSNDTIMVRLPDGSFHSMNKMTVADHEGNYGKRNLVLENHEGADFTLKVEQARQSLIATVIASKFGHVSWPIWVLVEAELILADGTRYVMDQHGRVSQITDPQRLNEINLAYDLLLLDTITDSLGRTLRFEYTDNFLVPRIETITIEDDAPHHRQISYEYESGLLGEFGVAQPVLKAAVDAGGRRWEYEYERQFMFAHSAAVKVNPALLIADIFTGAAASKVGSIFGVNSVTLSISNTYEVFFPLVSVTGPGIGTNKVTNSVVDLKYTEIEAADYFLGLFPTSVEFSLDARQRLLAERVTTYADPSGTAISVTSYDYHLTYFDHGQYYNPLTIVDDGRSITEYHYDPKMKLRTRWIDAWDWFLDLGSALSPFTSYMFLHEVVPIHTATITHDAATGAVLETVDREWDTENLRLVREHRQRADDVHREQRFRYDAWGNQTYLLDIDRVGARQAVLQRWTRYVKTDSAGADGAPWRESPFTIGNVVRPIHTLVAGTVVANHQPPEADGAAVIYGHTYFDYDLLGQRVAQAEWTGDGWAHSTFAYDANHGSRTEAVNPIGHRTTWAYDFDSAEAFYITQTEHGVVAADGSASNLVTRRGFERSSGLLSWEQSPRGYVTALSYDALGRTVTTVLSDDDDDVSWDPRAGPSPTRANNPVTTIGYDDVAFHSDVTTPRGAFTRYDYDPLGRLVEIDKHIRGRDANGVLDGGSVAHAVTAVTYNSWGDIASVTNPLGATTSYDYDATGRLTTTTHPTDDGVRASRSAAFDYTANTNTITDERGNLTIQVLDMADRVVEERRFTDQGAIETRAYFDGLGNEVVVVDGNGNTVINRYDARGLLERTVLPEAESFEDGSFVVTRPYVRFAYDGAGNRIATYTSTAAGGGGGEMAEIAELATVDGLGRTIRVTRPFTEPDSGAVVEAVVESYFDADGNVVRVVDANNSILAGAQQLAITSKVSARGQLLAETDQAGNRTSYAYDAEDNRIGLTDPRQNSGAYPGRDFSAAYHYDDLNRLILSELPPNEPGGDKLRVGFAYDLRGNLLSRTDPDGGVTRSTYTARNFLATETRAGHRRDGTSVSYTTSFQYDAAGNRTLSRDNAGNETELRYDQLNRVVETIFPEGNTELISYDGNDNVSRTVDGRTNSTAFRYDAFNRLVETIDAAGGSERIWYDTRRNQTRVEDANGNVRTAGYDERGLLVEEIDSLGQLTTLRYDLAGNRRTRVDPNGTEATYTYTPQYLLESVDYTNTARGQTHRVSYRYDETGFVTRAQDGGVVSRYNQPDGGAYLPDAYGRITDHIRELDGRSFPISYQYDVMQRITAVDVPSGPLARYLYNTMGELEQIPGYIDTPITYAANGLIDSAVAANGVTTTFAFDGNLRLASKAYDTATRTLKAYAYQYDDADNIIGINRSSYFYDALNRLTAADLNGAFAIDVREKEATTSWRQLTGAVADDHAGAKALSFATDEVELRLDYAATSIGVDLEDDYQISRIELDTTALSHRIHSGALSLWIADVNTEGAFTELTDWLLVAAPDDQRLTIRLREPVRARYLKIHSHHDERDAENQPVDAATIRNTRSALVTVTYMLDWRLESYTYDPKGNRLTSSVTLEETEARAYTYYANSDRLKTDGRYGYTYDANGNLTGKATGYTVLADGSLVLDEAGDEYWRFEWDLLNRLVAVTKNGTVAASYRYDADGLRVRRTGLAGVTYYDYDTSGRIVYEESTTRSLYTEYVYGGGSVVARANGRVGAFDSGREIQFYMTDHLGSTVMLASVAGDVLWQETLAPYGEQSGEVGFLKHDARYASKDLDPITTLYYFNARWFDAEAGRFITNDSVRDGPNWFVYAANNPLRFVDPSGYAKERGEQVARGIAFGTSTAEFAIGLVLFLVPEPATSAVGLAMMIHGGVNVGAATTSAYFYETTNGDVELSTTAVGLAAQGVAVGVADVVGKTDAEVQVIGAAAGAAGDLADTTIVSRRLPTTATLSSVTRLNQSLNATGDVLSLAESIEDMATLANQEPVSDDTLVAEQEVARRRMNLEYARLREQ